MQFKDDRIVSEYIYTEEGSKKKMTRAHLDNINKRASKEIIRFVFSLLQPLPSGLRCIFAVINHSPLVIFFSLLNQYLSFFGNNL